MKIIITTLDNLPEYCWNCPCCSSVGRCRADEERRKTSEYRPFWCPLREEKESALKESVHPALIYSVPLHLEELITVNEEEKIRVAHCDRCGKIVESNSLTTVVKIKHGGTSKVNYPHDGKFVICKNCEQWLLKQLTNNKEEEEEK
jgi:ribosomal protein S26